MRKLRQCGLWTLPVLALAQTSHRPPRGVASFEQSAFCKQYRCALTGPAEPLAFRGVVSEYFYNYRVTLPDQTKHPGQFGFRLTPEGQPGSPVLIVRWTPYTAPLTSTDITGLKQLFDAITGVPEFDAGVWALDYSRQATAAKSYGYGPKMDVGKYQVQCSWTGGKPNQFTLLLFGN